MTDRIQARAFVSDSGVGLDASTQVSAEEALFSALEKVERRVAGAMARVSESVVALEYTAADSPTGARRVATGVVISEDGEVLSIRIDRPSSPARASSTSEAPAVGVRGARNTRPRVTRVGSPPIIARDAAGRRHTALWVAADPETGLTLLRIAPNLVRPVRVAADPPKLGNSVFVVGNPFGLGHSVSRGHVAGLDRTLELGSRQLGGLTQVQVPLYPGDSGATVANLRGEWLGLIRGGVASTTPSPSSSQLLNSEARGRDYDSARNSEMDHDHDIGFAIPARDALWVADQLRSSGRVDRAFLGVRLETAEATSTEGHAADQGAELSEVLADSPAEEAGLRTGDRIVMMDAQPIRSSGDLTDQLDRTRAHSEIKLGVLRRRVDVADSEPSYERIEVSLRPASRPSVPSPSTVSSPALGAAASKRTESPIVEANSKVSAAATPAVASTPEINPPLPVALPIRAVVSKTSSSTPTASESQVSSAKAVPLRPATVATPTPSSGLTPSLPSQTQRPLPLESPVNPPRPAELDPISPRAVIERLERIERRLERIERRESPASPLMPTSRPLSTGVTKPRD